MKISKRYSILSAKPQEHNMNKKYLPAVSILLAAAPVIALVFCLGFGRYELSLAETTKLLWTQISGGEVDPTAYSVVFKVRLPRLILAFLTGAGLAVAGTSFQSLFGNPMATPDTLGVATGASFGAVLGLLISDNMVMVQMMAFGFGLLSLVITCLISRMNGKSSIIMVVLSGMVVSSIFQALVSLAKYVADPEEELPAITYWLMGSMSRATAKSLMIGAPFIIIGILLLLALRWRLNILSLPEDEAKALGIPVKKLRALVMVASTMVTASCVSMCGQVGWVGLLVPHMARMIYGSDNRRLVPACIGIGATFMIIIDTVARAATSSEIPVSILTALIGAPFFILLLKKTGGTRL